MDEDKKPSAIETCYSETMGFNADSVEWCLFPESAQFMTCATYHLNEDKNENHVQTRSGNISLYKLASRNIEKINLQKVYVIDTGGVLDMKWCPNKINNSAVLGVAGSDGQLRLLKLLPDIPSLEQFESCNLANDDKKLVLSLDWKENENLSVIASDSSGKLNFCVVRESGIEVISVWKAHEYEAWIAAFNYSSQNIMYSGGDDCLFKGWDARSNSTIFVKKQHTMGVTAISHCKVNENFLISGSYDENVLLWDVRSMKNAVSDIKLGGGIWRLKWHPTDPAFFLSASMHNGVHLVSILGCIYFEKSFMPGKSAETYEPGLWEALASSKETMHKVWDLVRRRLQLFPGPSWDDKLSLDAHFDGHDSMAYGVDWCYLPGLNNISGSKIRNEEALLKEARENLVSSCSFYDKLLHVWKIKC